MITDNNVLVSRVKDKIKKLIESRNVTVYELAQKSDLTEACIRNWFTKRNYTPSLEALEKISKAFQIEPFELLCEDAELHAKPRSAGKNKQSVSDRTIRTIMRRRRRFGCDAGKQSLRHGIRQTHFKTERSAFKLARKF
jgi:transcriptional regulator with XRE-family HTH domain